MARSSSIGGIFAELTLRDQKFATGMKGAGAKLKAFGAASVRYGAMAGAAISAGLLAGTKQTLAMGGQLSDLSAQTGVAVGDLMRIQQAYKDNGKDAASAAKDINKMQRAIYEASQDPGGSTDYFAQLGLSAEKLMEMSAADQFATIAKSIMRVSNQTKQAAVAMDIFGRSGGQLLTVFKGTDLDSINRTLGEMPKLMEKMAGEFDYADDLISRLPGKSTQFFTGFTAGVVGNIIPSLEMIDGFEFTNIGKSLGDSLSKALITTSANLAILFNSFTQMGSGETPIDAYRRFAAEQKELEMQDQAAAEERKRQREADAAYEKARMLEYMNAPDYVDPASLISEKKEAAMKPRSFSTPEFSDYQRRGLSLSESPSANLEKKTLDVMVEVRNILARIERTPATATF
jgi:hypothetical protein